MAILIGVIALAVIPNIQRSRESKDLTTLDNVLSSANIAIANNQISGAGSFVVGGAASTTSGTGADKVKAAVEKELGTTPCEYTEAANGEPKDDDGKRLFNVESKSTTTT